MRSSSRLVTGFCHWADRVSDSEIGGVRKVKDGIGDVSPTTGVDLSRAVDAKCCNDPLRSQPIKRALFDAEITLSPGNQGGGRFGGGRHVR